MPKHSGVYPYPTQPGMYADIPGWIGGIFDVPAQRNSHTIAAGYRRGIYWRPTHCAYETLSEALYARGEI